MVVAIQTVVVGRAVFEQRRNATAVCEENVEIAIVVKIKDSYAPSVTSTRDLFSVALLLRTKSMPDRAWRFSR